MGLAVSVVMTQRKEVKTMKIATSFLAALLFTGTLGAFNNAIAEDGILSKDQFAGTNYCHEKSRQSTLGDDQPELKDSNTSIASSPFLRWFCLPLGAIAPEGRRDLTKRMT